MSSTSEQIEKLVASPSVSAVTYQALALIRELEGINHEEYLLQACRIRDVFLCIVDYVLEELWDLQTVIELSAGPTGTALARVRALATLLHDIYAYTRYLRASAPRQSPPGIQVALAQLTDTYFPKINGEPVSLVRPQWKYNLTYVPMSWHLEALMMPSVLDPDDKLGSKDSKELLKCLWERNPRRTQGQQVPTQLAVLSFAGLDTHDTLLYPLLAHELGHFIDFSFTPPLNLRNDLKTKAAITFEQVRDKLEQMTGTKPDGQRVSYNLNILVQQVFVAIREIIADLLATRMLGFATFVAQSEFLKTLAPWPQGAITSSGYPGIRFRLQIIFEHLINWMPNNCLAFFRDHVQPHSELAEPLVRFLESWAERLKPSAVSSPMGVASGAPQLIDLVENAVRAVLPDLHQLVKDVVSDAKAAQLTEMFFSRVERLLLDLPPACASEPANSFAEVVSAGWAYQIIHGEQREAGKPDRAARFAEYEKTCRLVLKAIELSSTGANVGAAQPSFAAASPNVISDEGLANGGTLGMRQILSRIGLPQRHPMHLDVMPLGTNAVQGASLDLRLGHWFAVDRRTRMKSVELGNPEAEALLMAVGRELIFVPPEHTFVVHPGDMILGATLEFVGLPADIMAFVEGKSGLGRKGLIVATASQVAPGFHGVIVLEMVNAGTVPLELKPGMPIAQLVLFGMTEAVPQEALYQGKYYCQVHP